MNAGDRVGSPITRWLGRAIPSTPPVQGPFPDTMRYGFVQDMAEPPNYIKKGRLFRAYYSQGVLRSQQGGNEEMIGVFIRSIASGVPRANRIPPTFYPSFSESFFFSSIRTPPDRIDRGPFPFRPFSSSYSEARLIKSIPLRVRALSAMRLFDREVRPQSLVVNPYVTCGSTPPPLSHWPDGRNGRNNLACIPHLLKFR